MEVDDIILTFNETRGIPGIYIYSDADRIRNRKFKIGQSTIDIDSRVKDQDNSAVASELEIVFRVPMIWATSDEIIEAEKTIHKELYKNRTRKEWFEERNGVDLNDFRGVCIKVVEEIRIRRGVADSVLYPFIGRYYQIEGRYNVKKTFEQYDRCWINWFCGTGKSFETYWIFRDLLNSLSLDDKDPSGVCVYRVPSTDLILQTKGDWEKLAKADGIEMTFLIHSESSEERILKEMELASPEKPLVIFSCYQGSTQINRIIRKSAISVDLIIHDEAHRLAGIITKTWSKCLLDSYAPSKKKFFCTASPIFYEDSRDSTKDITKRWLSFHDEERFGKLAHSYTYSQALKDGYCSPIRLGFFKIKKHDVENLRSILNQNEYIRLKLDKFQQDSLDGYSNFMMMVAVCISAIKEHQSSKIGKKSNRRFISKITHILSYTNTNTRSNDFVEVIRNLCTTLNLNQVYIEALTGEISTKKRKLELREFEKKDFAIITNCMCLQEGVSIDRLNSVLLVDPKESISNLIQIAGRLSRLYNGIPKDDNYMIFPIVGEYNEEGKFVISKSAFRIAMEVMVSLVSTDKDLKNVIIDDDCNLVDLINDDLKKGFVNICVGDPKFKKKKAGGGNRSERETKEEEPVYEMDLVSMLKQVDLEIVNRKAKIRNTTGSKESVRRNIKTGLIEYILKLEESVNSYIRTDGLKMHLPLNEKIMDGDFEKHCEMLALDLGFEENDVRKFLKPYENRITFLYKKVVEFRYLNLI